MIRTDRRITIDNIATKVCSRCAPRYLTQEHTRIKMGLSSQHHSRHAEEGKHILNRIVTFWDGNLNIRLT
ncbi:hypothetical protein Trydic_g15576 [Trypoxylus dichotomus]